MRQAHGLCCGLRRLNAEPAIRFLGQKDSIQKRAPGLCRVPDCHAASAWHILRSEGDLDAEPTIRLFSQKDSIQKSNTLTLQDARLPYNKRMAYATVGGGLDAEPAIGLSRSEG